MSDIFSSGFDDLVPGDGFTTYGRTITESDLIAFSGLTGDHHPLHTDAEWAAGSLFGSRIAHGMLLLSYSVGLAPIDPERVAALRGFDRVRFKRPVRIGDTIRLEGKLEEVKALDDETGLVRLLWKVVNQENRLVVRANAEIVWRRSPAEEENPSPTVPMPNGVPRSASVSPEAVYL